MKKNIIKILLPIIFSLITTVFLIFLFGKHYFKNWYLEMVSINSEESTSRVIIQSPAKVEVTQDLRVKGIMEQAQPSMVAIYNKKTVGKDVVSKIYKPEDLVGYGVILTSDGWIMTAGNNFEGIKSDKLVVIHKNEIKEVSKIFVDQTTNTVLLKITSNDLPVIKFGSREELIVGEQLLAINQAEVSLTNISNLNYSDDLLHSSEKYYQYLLLANKNLNIGSAVINFQGNLVGMVVAGKDINMVVPMDFLQKSIKTVLKNDKIESPYLGVYFLDLSNVVGLNGQTTKDLLNGALLYGRGAVHAIGNNSPLSGVLLEGDIITSINSIEINSKNSLTDLILDQKSGDVITIGYMREAKKTEVVEVVLK